jgi:chromate reductase, NAD(P)H dehydrogenase (quinone)
MNDGPIKVLAISGSLRSDSYNRGLLRAAQELAPAGAEVDLYDGWADVPAFNEDLEADPPESVERMRARIDAADGLLIATPEYNGSVPGGLKNALDWASRPHGLSVLVAKPAAVLSSSTTPFGAAWSGEQMRRALVLSGAAVVERELAFGKVDERFAGGELADSETRAEVAGLVEELVESIAAMSPRALAA